MADLHIRVIAKEGKTVSQYAADKIWFHNDGSAELTIGFKPGQSPNLAFCKNRNDDHTKGQTSLQIDPGKKDDVYICKDFPGTSFGYTAQITGTVLEDPIIIIQKDSVDGFISENLLAFGAGLLFGIVAALLAQRLFVKQRPT